MAHQCLATKRGAPIRDALRSYSYEVAGNTIPPLRGRAGRGGEHFSRNMTNGVLRRFCWTLNNYTEDDVASLQKDLTELCKFAIFGREVCPTTGTEHLQGFW